MWTYVAASIAFLISGQLADVPWPRYRHDMQNTSLSRFRGPDVPKVIWTDILGYYSSPPLVVHDNSIFIYVDDYYNPDAGLMLFDEDGRRRWTIKGKGFYGGGFWSSNGMLFIFGPDGTDLNWVTEDGSMGTVFSAKDVNEVFQGVGYFGRDNALHLISYLRFYDQGKRSNYKLLTIDRDGNVLWTYPLEIEPSGMAVDLAGNIYLTDFWHGVLLSVRPAGVTNWVFENQDIGFFDNPVIGHEGTIYMGTGRGLYALRPDGTVKWVAREDVQFRDPSLSPKGGIVVAGNVGEPKTLYAASLYSFAPDGSLNWVYEKDPDGQEITIPYPPVIDADGTVYIGDEYIDLSRTFGYLRAINSDGTLKWVFGVDFTGHPVSVGTPAIGYCNRLYFTGRNVLYALGEDLDGGVEDCSYPEVGYDDVGHDYDVGVDGGLADSGVDGASEDAHVQDSSDADSDGGSRDVEAPERDTGLNRADANVEVFVSAPGCGCAMVGL